LRTVPNYDKKKLILKTPEFGFRYFLKGIFQRVISQGKIFQLQWGLSPEAWTDFESHAACEIVKTNKFTYSKDYKRTILPKMNLFIWFTGNIFFLNLTFGTKVLLK